MGSSRFPGKPLALIKGEQMILHVLRNCLTSTIASDVYVATCDTEIRDCVIKAGGQVVMTSPSHERASDRCAEAIQILAKQGKNYAVTIMVQGDEPLVTGAMIDKVSQPLLDQPRLLIANGCGPLSLNDLENPNVIKILKDLNDNAIYMTRCSVPYKADLGVNVARQICIIPFRTNFLLKYASLSPTPLEISESIDMNRVLEHGYTLKLVALEEHTHAVDHESDIKVIEGLL